MLIHILYTWLGLCAGFLIACVWLGSRLTHSMQQARDLRRMIGWLMIVPCETVSSEKSGRRFRYLHKNPSETLTDDESDALWDQIMFGNEEDSDD